MKLKAYKNETYSHVNYIIISVRCEHSYGTKAQYFSLVDMMKYCYINVPTPFLFLKRKVL